MAASARDHEVQCSEVPLQDTVTGEGSWRDWRLGGICGARELFLQGQIWGYHNPNIKGSAWDL